MSREIKFRGNNLVTKEEVFGHLFYFDDGRYFISPKGVVVEGDEGECPSEYYLRGVKCIEVEPETVSQYTGLKGKNGIEIYEGDIVRVTDGDERTDFSDGGIGTVCGMTELYMWYIGGEVQNGLFDIKQSYYIEVIGNVHNNPELLEREF